MNAPHALLLCLLSGAVCAVPTFTKTEGDTLVFGCVFGPPPGSRFFTKRESDKDKVLIETSDLDSQSGRYGVKYDAEIDLFYVSISQLSSSDSGRYRCGLGNASLSESQREFEVRVTDAMCDVRTDPGVTVCAEPEGGSVRVRCSFPSAEFFTLFFCKDQCKRQDVLIQTDELQGQSGRYGIEHGRVGVFYVTIANLTKSDSGVYRCGVDLLSSPNPCLAVELKVTGAREPTAHSLIPSSGSCTASPPVPAVPTDAAPGVEPADEGFERQQCARGAVCAVPTFTKTEGETLEFGCFFGPPPGSRFFTKRESDKDKVLIETSDLDAQNGKYGIKYDAEIDLFYVSISQLSSSNSGRYRCGLGNASLSESQREFEVRVTDAMCDMRTDPGVTGCAEPEGGSVRVRCSFSPAEFFTLFFCKDQCKRQDVLIQTKELQGWSGRYGIERKTSGVFYVTIANLTKSDSGVYRCGLDLLSSPNPCLAVELKVTGAREPTAHSLIPSSGSCTAFPPVPAVPVMPTSAARSIAPTVKGSVEQQQSESSGRVGHTVAVVVCVAVVLLVAILLILYKKTGVRSCRGTNPKESSTSEDVEQVELRGVERVDESVQDIELCSSSQTDRIHEADQQASAPELLQPHSE
ncbi:polymeric immunoglobulin receptor-like [Pempheris klunzingeri]|uniref:polymeric immunoglobulin receptor-like n=1 Tax=Pempheris klunzingeri TaxID=3127111 RepID=UPI0039815F99